MSRLVITTSRYWSKALIVKSGLAPVGASIGLPKFPVGYDLVGSVGMLAPFGLLGIEDHDEFRRRYRRRLNGYGVEKIQWVLTALAKGGTVSGDGKLGTPYLGVVLLCFEDLSKPSEWCHRRMFAEWWEEKTGDTVPELTLELLEAAK